MPQPPVDLDIVHATDRFVVVNKPSGMLSVPGRGPDKQDCVVSRVRAAYPRAEGPITVHRLDMDTSGLIICALDSDAQRILSGQFERRQIEKRYIALVDGVVARESGTVDVPVRADITNRPYQIVDRSHGRPARTSWRILSIETDRTRLELIPLTGRTHQLRVHCAYPGPGGMRGPKGDPAGRGHPILGDILYGPPWIDPDDAGRLMLHAAAVTLTDPDTGERIRVTAPPAF